MSLNSRSDTGSMKHDTSIIGPADPILVTGATGFIGSRVVAHLLDRGFRNVRCLARASSDPARVNAMVSTRRTGGGVEVIRGNLLSREDCLAAVKDVTVIFHLAAARG